MNATRQQSLAQLADAPLDLLVIGGGILGAGIVRDAAMRRLRVGLVEQFDFAEGTSSRSSRLLHGGLRYLAQGHLGLVREAGREKNILAHIAPHLACPLPFIFPTYRGTPWPKWQLAIGVRLYDLLCGVKGGPRSGTLSRTETLDALPWLADQNLTGGVQYGDGLTNDARLVIDTLRSASKYDAILLNHVSLIHATRARAGGRWNCRLRDTITGQELDVQTLTIANAAGPWADKIQPSHLHLRLTKGIHLMIDRAKLPLSSAAVMTQGNRILFAIPYGQRIILGTTDTDYSGPLDDVRTDLDDVQYLLNVVNGTFPKAGIELRDIVAEWAGLRPLIAQKDGSPSDISRKHLIVHHGDGWVDIAGGKLTTYRRIAQEAVDQIAHYLHQGVPCRTHIEPLLNPCETLGISGIEPPSLEPKIIEHFCHNEWAMHLDDVMVRRGRWTSYHRNARAIARQVAGMMAQSLGWGAARQQAEVQAYERKTASVLDPFFSAGPAAPH